MLLLATAVSTHCCVTLVRQHVTHHGYVQAGLTLAFGTLAAVIVFMYSVASALMLGMGYDSSDEWSPWEWVCPHESFHNWWAI